MKIELGRAEIIKAVNLYLANQGIDLESKSIKCKLSRESVLVVIEEKEKDLTPTKDLDTPEKEQDSFFEE